MDPVTPRISSRPARLICLPGGPDMAPRPPTLGRAPAQPWRASGLTQDVSSLRLLAFVLHAVLDLGGGDLFERHAGRLLVPGLDAPGGAAVELPGPLGREHDEQVAVRDLVERLFERGERHQFGTSRSGNVRARRATRQRSAWMMDSSCSMASFTSRFTI